MRPTFLRSSGLLLILAGLTFWLGYIIMPMYSNGDPVQMLTTIAHQRTRVWWSVMTHLISSLIFVIAVIGLQTDRRASRSKTMRVGAILVLIGAMGLSLHAFYHLITYFMSTSGGLSAQNMAEPMQLLQTRGTLFFKPLLLSLLIGGTVYSAGFYHIDATSPWSKRVFLVGLAWGLIGSGIVSRTGLGQNILTQGFLAWVTLAYCWLGFEVLFRLRPDKSSR